MSTAPAPRPAQGFSTSRAQQWVLAAAIVSAVIYAFRRAVEPTTSPGTAKGGTAAKLIGAGSPPPTLEHWAVGFSAGYLMLAVLAMAAPELAAALALMFSGSNLLANGTTIAADLAGLEGAPPTTKAAAK